MSWILFVCLGLSGGFLDATTRLSSPLALPASGATASLKGLVMNGLGGVVFMLSPVRDFS